MAIGPFITIVSFLFSWITAWTNLILALVETATSGSQNPHVVLPLAVLLLGLVMTNTLGFLEFYYDKRMKMASIAAVDLDTPYILYTAKQEILADVHNKDFANLQLRQALWRTIPLGMVGFFLAFRMFLEIPMCQLTADLSRLQVGLDIQTDKDPLMEDLKRDKIAWSKLSMYNRWKNQSAEDTRDPDLALSAEKTIAHVWANCQCSDGRWEMVEKGPEVTTIFPLTIESTHNRAHLGGLGTGSLLAFNIILTDEALSILANRGRALQETFAVLAGYFAAEGQKTKSRVRQNVAKLSASVIAMASDWKAQLKLQALSIKALPMPGVMQNRGWWNFVKLLQSTLLLLAAALPIQKCIVKHRLVVSGWHKACIGVHCAMDLVLSTAAVIFCSLAPAAEIFGSLLQLMLKEEVDLILEEKAYLDHFASALSEHGVHYGIDRSKALGYLGQSFSQIFFAGTRVYKNVLERVENFSKVVGLQQTAFFLTMSLGILSFWIVSAIIAKALMPKKVVLPFINYVSAGIGGPLYLLSVVEEMHVRKAAGQVLTMIVARIFLLTILVGLSAWRVSAFGKRAFVAIFFNQTAEISWTLIWLALALPHLFSGGMAVYAIETNHDLLGKQSKAQKTQAAEVQVTEAAQVQVALEPSPVKSARTTARRASGVPPPPLPPKRTSIISKR